MAGKAKSRTAEINQYNRENRTRYVLAYSNKYDKDVVQKLNSVENKADYVRTLILKDISKHRE